MVSIHPYGPHAWLIDDVSDPAGWAAGLDAVALGGVEDIVPAEASVLVITAPEVSGEIARHLAEVIPRPRRRDEVPVEIPVTYDGDDLATVAAAVGATIAEVVALHSGGDYRVAFCGFSPGFAYLAGLPDRLRLPRRERPRTRVPAGAVAMAAHYSAVYPSPSPGGWHLLGHTDEIVWDARRQPPTRLRPGTPVRFVEVRS